MRYWGFCIWPLGFDFLGNGMWIGDWLISNLSHRIRLMREDVAVQKVRMGGANVTNSHQPARTTSSRRESRLDEDYKILFDLIVCCWVRRSRLNSKSLYYEYGYCRVFLGRKMEVEIGWSKLSWEGWELVWLPNLLRCSSVMSECAGSHIKVKWLDSECNKWRAIEMYSGIWWRVKGSLNDEREESDSESRVMR